jgi:hypothetical protein
MAYTSNETGRYEIYVQPFPGPGYKLIVSTGGGSEPHWRRDGKELDYVSLGVQKLMAVGVNTQGSLFKVSAPHALFGVTGITPSMVLRPKGYETFGGNNLAPARTGRAYVASADGQSW